MADRFPAPYDDELDPDYMNTEAGQRSSTHPLRATENPAYPRSAIEQAEDRRVAQEFHELFSGNERHHGTHGALPPRSAPSAKIKPDYRTLPGPATVELWLEHLNGTRALGIVPITDDHICYWGCIDVDDYNKFQHRDVAIRSERLGLPLIVCRSKSGGAHIYVFFSEPVCATKVRQFLFEIATILDFRSVEIFPKQAKLEVNADGLRDKGSWINVPYFDARRGMRYAVLAEKSLSVDEFVGVATDRRVAAKDLDDIIACFLNNLDVSVDLPTELEAEAALFSNDDVKYAATMLKRYAEKVEHAPEGDRNNTLNKATFHLATMVARGWIGQDEVIEAMMSAAHRCGLMDGDERKTTQRTIRGAIQRGIRRPHKDRQQRPGEGRGGPDMLAHLSDEFEGFHTADGAAFADIRKGEHRETWPIKSHDFRLWLTARVYEKSGKAPTEAAIESALKALEAKALFRGPERVVAIRAAEQDGRFYLDLCNAKWEAIEIDGQGWRVTGTPPVRFRRTKGMQPLPMPLKGGSIEELRPFINVETNDDFVLAIAWLLAALNPQGPYPILATSGAEGSAKTSFCRMLRALTDPNVVELRAPPKDNRSLFVAAKNNHVLGFDNFSFIRDWMSDTLCRIATGGGHAERTNYTDDEETLFTAKRPILLNGIPEVINRPDLANRTISVTLEPIEKEKRRPERELWTAFEEARPKILGGLLDAVSEGLNMLHRTQLAELPRMADFARWIAACEGACPWARGTFERAYAENSEATADVVAEGDDVAQSVINFMRNQPERRSGGSTIREWTGTATELLALLNADLVDRDHRTWPKGPRGLRSRLTRCARTLKERERITIQRSRQAHEGRVFTISAYDLEDGIPF